MFWGLNLKPNRKYTQTAAKSFHISHAALQEDAADGPTRVFLSVEQEKYLLCTLRKDKCDQVMLDLNFAEGDQICLQSIGSGIVSLSGYLIQDMDELNGEDDESEDEAFDLRQALTKKLKEKLKNSPKEVEAGDDDDDDDEDDSDFDADATAANAAENVSEEDSDEEEEGSDDDEDEEEEEGDDDDEGESDDEDEEEQQPKAKQPKLDKPQKQQNGVVKEAADKKSKKDKNKEQQKSVQKVGGEKTLSGGVKIEDIRVGNGPEAKQGKRAQVYYEGRLKSNNKVFDSLKQGSGFKFGLGRGEVIKGWDIGVVGMKVGGKRRIICPPHMAYGARGSPPTVPPNSTLVFEVELKHVN